METKMVMDESKFSEPQLYSMQNPETSQKPIIIQKNMQQTNSPFFKKKDHPMSVQSFNDTFKISSLKM